MALSREERLANQRAAAKRLRDERRAAGQCQQCGEPLGIRSTILCDEHAEEQYRYHRKRAGSSKAYGPRIAGWARTNAPLNEGLITNCEEREVDPWKALCCDILVLAVLDHKRGQCDPEFWFSREYELYCDLIGWHPDYIRNHLDPEPRRLYAVSTEDNEIASGIRSTHGSCGRPDPA